MAAPERRQPIDYARERERRSHGPDEGADEAEPRPGLPECSEWWDLALAYCAYDEARWVPFLIDQCGLRPHHFPAGDARRTVFRAMYALHSEGRVPYIGDVLVWLDQRGEMEAAGGRVGVTRYMRGLMDRDAPPTEAEAGAMARTIMRVAAQREAIRLAQTLALAARDGRMAEMAATATQVVALQAEYTPVAHQLLTESDLAALPDITYLIAGWLPDHGLTAIYGDSDAYKTFLLLDWLLRMQRGLDWLGRHVERRQCVYVCAEGLGGLSRRITAWKLDNGVSEPTGLLVWPRPVNLMDAADVAGFVAAVRAEVTGPIGGVALDTLALCTPGADPKQDRDVNLATAGARAISAGLDNAAVILVDHEGKDAARGMSGSNKKRANADCVIHVARETEGSNIIWVTSTKARDEQRPAAVRLAAQQVRWATDDGETRSSLVLVSAGGAPSPITAPLAPERRRVLDILAGMAATNPEGVLRADWQRAAEAGGIKPDTARRYVRELAQDARFVRILDLIGHVIPAQSADSEDGGTRYGTGTTVVRTAGDTEGTGGTNGTPYRGVPRTAVPIPHDAADTARLTDDVAMGGPLDALADPSLPHITGATPSSGRWDRRRIELLAEHPNWSEEQVLDAIAAEIAAGGKHAT